MSCCYKFVVGKKKGESCINKLAKRDNEYCAKHRKIMDKINSKKAKMNFNIDPVFNDAPKTPVVRDVKELKSIYNITINSNKNYYDMSDEQKQKFKTLITYLFDKENPAIVKYLEDATNKDNPKEHLIKFDSEFRFEVSPSHKLHTHAQFDTTHTGHYRIRRDDLADVINKYLGYNTHLNIKVQKVSTNQDKWGEYIGKNYKAVDL